MWAAIKDWQIREWLTLLFAASAAIVPWVVHLRNVRRAKHESDAIWSIKLKPHMKTEPATFLWADLRVENAHENRLHLISLVAKSPRGLRITGWKTTHETSGNPVYLANPVEPQSVLAINRDLDAHRTYGAHTVVHDHSEFSFLIQMPPHPWFAKSGRVRAEIVAIIESISSSRRRSRIRIKTQPIAWAISNRKSIAKSEAIS